MYVCMYASMYVCVCVCVCMHAHEHAESLSLSVELLTISKCCYLQSTFFLVSYTHFSVSDMLVYHSVLSLSSLHSSACFQVPHVSFFF
jgi:hypothetical protein